MPILKNESKIKERQKQEEIQALKSDNEMLKLADLDNKEMIASLYTLLMAGGE
ncbi:hypothetical protein MKY95_10240 [Paenibacillus sp. FSL P4-0176]|uniref:hypothetical protein n=1 Tax=Paenibacillus sp. FSL P4-0176 TaxID=2921631 RepID=UPI0030D03ACD